MIRGESIEIGSLPLRRRACSRCGDWFRCSASASVDRPLRLTALFVETPWRNAERRWLCHFSTTVAPSALPLRARPDSPMTARYAFVPRRRVSPSPSRCTWVGVVTFTVWSFLLKLFWSDDFRRRCRVGHAFLHLNPAYSRYRPIAYLCLRTTMQQQFLIFFGFLYTLIKCWRNFLHLISIDFGPIDGWPQPTTHN